MDMSLSKPQEFTEDQKSPGFSVHGISEARKLEHVAISFCKGSSQPRDRNCVSCIGRYQGSPKTGLSTTVFYNNIRYCMLPSNMIHNPWGRSQQGMWLRSPV